MQAASDVFLGWTHGRAGRGFYVRQLRDMKIKPPVELFSQSALLDYATLCGWTLARAHARSGDPAMMAGYIGKSDIFDKAIAAFSKAYADQAEQDHAVFEKAIARVGWKLRPNVEGLIAIAFVIQGRCPFGKGSKMGCLQ
jgi:hypothetical protein